MTPMDLDPPAYPAPSPASPAPSYASLPRDGHSSIEYTPRAGRARVETGTLIKTYKDGSAIIFKHQDAQNDSPIYGRNSVVSGEIELEHLDTVVSVTSKLDCHLHLSSSDSGSESRKLVDQRHILWDSPGTGSTARCPTLVGFAIPFPMTFTDQDRLFRTPPTFETICLGNPLLVVKSAYSLVITVTRTSNRRLSFRKTASKSYIIPLVFRPRTRPARPILPNPTLFTTLKEAPAEWHQMEVKIPFLIPSVQTFCLADQIPFHIQLTGTRASLGLFYGAVSPDALAGKKSRRRFYSAVVRVFLARQIYLEVNARPSWRTMTVGEGKLEAIPPHESTREEAEGGATDIVSVNWEGQVRCREDMTCASFSTNHLMVKDFIIFALTPANARSSPLQSIRHAHPIRLVTDGYIDDDMAHPEDY